MAFATFYGTPLDVSMNLYKILHCNPVLSHYRNLRCFFCERKLNLNDRYFAFCLKDRTCNKANVLSLKVG
jgi:hypothetical protein